MVKYEVIFLELYGARKDRVRRLGSFIFDDYMQAARFQADYEDRIPLDTVKVRLRPVV